MKRHHDWVTRLQNLVKSRASTPFQYGSNDCGHFSADCIHAITGVDAATDFRGKYSTALGAARQIKRVTGSGHTVEDIAVHMAAKHGWRELPSVKWAHRGDLVLCDDVQGPALGIVYLDGVSGLFVGEGGLKRRPVLQCRRAWRIPYEESKTKKEAA